MPDVHFLRTDIRPETKPDILCNVTLLPFADESFDVIHSSHVLEHFPRAHWQNVLSEWLRILKPDGEIWLRLPNIKWACDRVSRGGILDTDVLNVLYGGQDNPFDFHYNGLTPERMFKEFGDRGYEMIGYSEVRYNMTLGARRKQVS